MFSFSSSFLIMNIFPPVITHSSFFSFITLTLLGSEISLSLNFLCHFSEITPRFKSDSNFALETENKKYASLSKTLPHFLHVAFSIRYINLAYPMCITGAASSMCPKCPGHSPIRPPQVLHLNPGSITPIHWFTNPMSIGKPSSP